MTHPTNDDKDAGLLDRRTFFIGTASAIALGTTACGGGSSGSFSPIGGAAAQQSSQQSPGASSGAVAGVDTPATPAPEPAAPEPAVRKIVHPGLLVTEDALQRIRDKLAAKAEPWVGGLNMMLRANTTGLDAKPRPLALVTRGVDGENYGQMVGDMVRALHYALRWKISNDESYAKKAVEFLNAWSSTLTELGGNSNVYLASGLYGNQWANAAELMRTYSGWAKEDVARFQAMLMNVFYPKAHDFLVNHNGSETRKVTHYWANWDLANICAVYAIGVFCDRPDLRAEASNYYKAGRGNGTSAGSVYYVHPGYLGQWQESHRDQGHSTLGISLAGMLCEMAWNQGEDLYGYWNNRLLAGAEYVARTNLTDANGNALFTMPFAPYNGVFGPATAAAGTGSGRPCWELIYNHYVNRKGLSAPWTKAMVDRFRPERVDGGDQPGIGTLLYARDPVAAAKPSGLSAFLNNAKVQLSWWGTAGASQYLVQRAASPNGPFTTLAPVTDPRTYTDDADQGTWYYRIDAVTDAGEIAGADTLRVAVPGELWLHLPLNGDANDASGRGLNAQLKGGTSWGEGRNGGSAVQLDGRSGHVQLPDGAVSALGDFTAAVWVYWDASVVNTRIFDFGSNDVAYISLIPRDGNGKLRFSGSRNQFWNEESVTTDVLPTQRWVHVAVTLSGTVGTLYVDGTQVATADGIWINPFQLGRTTQTWLGRSQYGGDPYFKGRMQDFRIYSGAQDAAFIANLAR
ncbi:LamG-like jellyroll fold domain-containing protein [Variovorax sp. 350MFTsu5.1]|uniref:LamG-like jellyroll fold domain-containing protein n=1 Tax=Variovorax sp. 350MFTsu5.1 TaxID=3158365 RepID=UPI003AAEF945